MIRLFPVWIRENPSLVQKVHALGRPVWAMSLTAQRDELEELIGYGVNGLFTDFPQMVARMRAESAGEK